MFAFATIKHTLRGARSNKQMYLLQDLAVVMVAAGVMTVLCHWLRQPVVIGYLLAGLIIGPYTPPFSLVSNLENIHTMAELGLVFLLFSLGLEFNLPKMKKVGWSGALAAVFEILGNVGVGYILGRAFGWGDIDSFFLGAILAMSSTTIIVKVFMDFKMMRERFTQIVFGILILEDIVGILFLSILSGLGSNVDSISTMAMESFFRTGLFIVLFLLVGLLVIPKIIHHVVSFKIKEVMGIITLGLCLGGALVAHFFQLSVALGAFLTGSVVAASKEIDEIEEWIHPVRDMFSAIFFVSAGMLIQPSLLWEHKSAILIISIVTIIGKVLCGTVGTFLAGYNIKTSTRVGMSLAQIGEFSFIIASVAYSLKITSNFLYPLTIMVSSLTTLATPYLIRNSDFIVEGLLKIFPSSLQTKIKSYHVAKEATKDLGSSKGVAVISKYWARLAIYLAISLALIMFNRGASIRIERECSFYNIDDSIIVLGLWLIIGVLALPLFTSISKYLCHILLLLVTLNKTILRRIDAHTFYNVLNIFTIVALILLFVGSASRTVPVLWELVLIFVTLAATGIIFRKSMQKGVEWLEGLLDKVTGLATSEPIRQSIIRSGDKKLLIIGMTDQISLVSDSSVAHHTIREIKLREQSGASIVSIYREGSHFVNPTPDMMLLPDDILILMGTSEEIKNAKRIMLARRSINS